MTTLQASSRTFTRVGSSTRLRDSTELLGRILLSILFFVSGAGKVAGYASTVTYMATAGVPGGAGAVRELRNARSHLAGLERR